MSLQSEERMTAIMDELERSGKVKVVNLAKRFEVTNETIRRDLDKLEQLGKLIKVYGGALKKSYDDPDPSYPHRIGLLRQEKRRIGQKATELVEDGDTIVIGVGTTMLEFAQVLRNKNVTILTTSVPVVTVYMNMLQSGTFAGKVIMICGELNPGEQSINGILGERMLQQFRVDKAFVSAAGIAPEYGLSDYDYREASMNQTMISVAKEVIVLADHSKFGVESFCQIAPMEAIDIIVTDRPIPDKWLRVFEDKGVTCLIADESDND